MKSKELMEINIIFKQKKIYNLTLRIIYLKTYTIIHINKTRNSSTHEEI